MQSNWRRACAAGLLALVTGAAMLQAPTASAAEGEELGVGVEGPVLARTVAPEIAPQAALRTAERVLDGEARAGDPSPSLALRDLFAALPALDGAEENQARRILARPSDGAADGLDHGYTVGSKRKCNRWVCVHYVTSTADAVPSASWVRQNLEVLAKVYRVEVERLGFRKPVADGRKGGNGKLDVYLKDTGDQGIYGYCLAEQRRVGKTASGYCVLDNDFAEFPGLSPTDNLRVTAAHEFFHAVQYAYDYLEDRWMMESTATWMEERVFDGINDNRQFLHTSQLVAPMIPLDHYGNAGHQYGNWIFWEYLTQRYGTSFVKRTWASAGKWRPRGKDRGSLQALKVTLRDRGGLTKVYSRFAAANLAPARSYSEGRTYPRARPNSFTLSKADRLLEGTADLHHLSSGTLELVPARELGGRRWNLKIVVKAGPRKKAPAAYVVVDKRRGPDAGTYVRFTRSGTGKATVPFSARKVRAVRLVLVNASTRFRCNQGTSYACQGVARDDAEPFHVKVRARKRR